MSVRARASRSSLHASLIFASLLAAPGLAAAQTAGGWSLDRYEPAPAGDTFFAAEHPWYTGAGRAFALRFGLVVDYANNPLTLRRGAQDDSTVLTRVVEHMLVGHAQVGVALFDRVGVHLSVPVSLWQDGDRASITALGPADGPALGDPRLGVRVRVFGDADRDPISLHVGAQVHLNAGWLGASRGDNTTDDAVRARFNVTLAGRASALRWSFGAGFHARSESTRVIDTVVDNDAYVTAAAGLVALHDRLTVGPELFASTVVDRAFEWRHVNAEVLVGAHYLIDDTVLVGVGAGPGLTEGAGTPAFRALAHVAYAPTQRAPEAPPSNPDSDDDGVRDADDACPTTPRGDHPDPTRSGCPATDTDGDGVYDHDDQCVSVAQGDRPDAARRGCPANAAPGDADGDGVLDPDDACASVPQGAFPDAARRGCPLPDRDRDTVPDARDRCPDAPGAPSTDAARNGCPNAEVSMDGNAINLLHPVYFATNRDVILDRSLPVLRAVADVLAAAPQFRRVRVEGHTDDVGNDMANLDLSNRRAASVVRWLTEHGVDAGRLEAQGYGESRPVRPLAGLAGAALAAARGQNRRVVFVIVDPAPAVAGDAAARP